MRVDRLRHFSNKNLYASKQFFGDTFLLMDKNNGNLNQCLGIADFK